MADNGKNGTNWFHSNDSKIGDEVREIVALLGFAWPDLRVEIGKLAVEIADAIDAGDVPTDGRTAAMLDQLVTDLTSRPNDPPGKIKELRYRRARQRFGPYRSGSGR